MSTSAPQRLSTREELVATLESFTGMAAALFRLDGTLLGASEAFRALLSRGTDSGTRWTWQNVPIGVEDGERGDYWDKLISGKQSSLRVVGASRGLDNQTRSMECWLVAVRDAQGHLEAVVAVMSGAMSGKRTVSAAPSDDRLRLALEATSDGVWDWDIQTGGGYFSPRYYTMLGYRPGEFPATYEAWRGLVHPEDIAAAEQNLRQSQERADEIYETEFRMRTRDGQWRWILARGRVVGRSADGRPARMIGTHVDITELKLANEERVHLERQMQHTQRLESLGVLAGGVAHDFNNLLAAIMGNAELALLDAPVDSPLRVLLEEISRAGRRAAELCRQMLAYSGRVRFAVRPTDLSRMVEELTQMLQVSVSKKVTLRFNLDRGLPEVSADASQMQQVLINLVINASEAIGEQVGTVTISTGCMQASRSYLVSCQVGDPLSPGRYAYMEVADTGAGMDADTLRRVFDPFFSTKFTGRGLGLAAVLGIISSHKGAIHVESASGRGTTFRVLLPVLDSTASNVGGAAPSNSGWTGQGRILLVDDEEQVRSMGTRILERLGFEVVPARDGREAVERCLAHDGSFACVLLDLTMPVMDGVETLMALRQHYPDLRVVLASGYSEIEVAQRLGDLNISGFIHKPFQIEEFRSQLKAAIED